MIINGKELDRVPSISRKASTYTKQMMKIFTESLWQESLNNQLQMEGYSRTPTVSTCPLIMPHSTSREQEVLIMSLFYKNNLLNYFLYCTEKKMCPSPLCVCGEEEQTAFHILCNCSLVDVELRDQIVYHLLLGNNAKSMEELDGDHISILNCSKDTKFIKLCRDVIDTKDLNLKRKIKLSKRSSSL